jgi:hypothetical protein
VIDARACGPRPAAEQSKPNCWTWRGLWRPTSKRRKARSPATDWHAESVALDIRSAPTERPNCGGTSTHNHQQPLPPETRPPDRGRSRVTRPLPLESPPTTWAYPESPGLRVELHPQCGPCRRGRRGLLGTASRSPHRGSRKTVVFGDRKPSRLWVAGSSPAQGSYMRPVTTINLMPADPYWTFPRALALVEHLHGTGTARRHPTAVRPYRTWVLEQAVDPISRRS